MEKFNPTHIIVVESGWVFAAVLTGEALEKDGIGVDLQLDACRCIIRFGTDYGLGQLAFSGPTGETKLGECAVTLIPANRVLYTLRVTSGEW